MSLRPEESAGRDVKTLVELEYDHILQILWKTGWRIEGKIGAAILLGLNASTLRARMRKYGIVRQQMENMSDFQKVASMWPTKCLQRNSYSSI
jgi:transcriptional regulator with GAF, ATPase, and Fis domain